MAYTKERRRYPRIQVRRVTVDVCNEQVNSNAPDFCRIENISESGMSFLSENKYSGNQKLLLTFVMGDNGVVIRTGACVVRCQIGPDINTVGVEFVRMATEDRDTICTHVAKNLDANPA